MTHGLELRVGVICPNVSRLHSVVTVLAICNRVPGHPLHPSHLAHPATGIFNEVKLGVQFPDKLKNVFVNLVTEFGVIAPRVKVARFRVSPPVVGNRRNAEGGAIRACPNHIRLSEFLNNVRRCSMPISSMIIHRPSPSNQGYPFGNLSGCRHRKFPC